MSPMFTQAVRILKARIGIRANEEDLLLPLPPEVALSSLLTDFHRVEEIEYGPGLDAYFLLSNEPGCPPQLEVGPEEVRARGDILRLTQEAHDLRYTLFGNEGLLFRHTLLLLESHYRIFSYHACALYDEEGSRMYIAPGGAGSGKTCLILKGLELGLKLFSAEMTHFRVEGGRLTLYKGALVDNIRVGNLLYTYPEVAKALDWQRPQTEDVWWKKIAVDLSQFQTPFDEITDCPLTLLFPHIEEERREVVAQALRGRREVRKMLFDNCTQKIGEPVLYYETIPVPSLDTPVSLRRRLEAVEQFLHWVAEGEVLRLVAGAHNCWDAVRRR
ncbi:MAG TPA: hypothetical protein EYP85_04620 [Armatimonadetes bacterium]|nr:hypothetical protein [Armatimonadota bacterium]